MADISKIKLPNGQEYNIKDATARQLISQGSFDIVWTKAKYAGSTAPTPEELDSIPSAATVYWNDGANSTPGTKPASSADVRKIFLVATKPAQGIEGDYYDEWIAVQEGSSWVWEKLGDTRFTGTITASFSSFVKALSTGTHTHAYDKVSGVTISNGTNGDVTVATGALSTNAAVALASSDSSTAGSITYVQSVGDAAAQGHTHSVDVTVPEKKIYVTSSGGSVSGGGYASPSSDTFAKSINTATGTVTAASADAVASLSPMTKKLVTASIYPAKSINTEAFVTGTTTSKFGKVDALTSVSGSVTAVAGRSSETVATGSITADNANGTVLTGASFEDTVKVVTATTNTSVVTGGSVQSTVMISASYDSNTETLSFSTGPQTAISSTNISVPSTMSTPSISVTKGTPVTTTVYSANAPTSIAATMSSTVSSVIGSSTVSTGASVNIITAATKESIAIDVRDTAVTVATGSTAADGTGADVVTSVASTAAKYLTGLSGSTTFVTVASVNSTGSALTGLGTQSSYTFTAPTVTLATGENTNAISVGADGAITGITIASTSTTKAAITTRYLSTSVSQQPVLATTKLSASASVSSVDTATNTGTIVTGVSQSEDAIVSVSLS